MKKKSKNTARFIPLDSLYDFLEVTKDQSLKIAFELHPSVKDLIESQGIPHTAVFKLEINGKEETLDYNVQDGDKIIAYPFDSVEIDSVDKIYSQPSSFIVDQHLGKLAKTLRLLGFDTSFDKSWNDRDIIQRSNKEQRMILTRDIELLKNGSTNYGYWIRSTNPDQQIKELFKRFILADKINPFTRCMKCNGILHKVNLNEVEDRVPPKVKEWHSDFFECSTCKQIYWRGSHYKKLEQMVNKLIELSSE